MRYQEIDAIHDKALEAVKAGMAWTDKFKPCKEEIIASGATTWPRSCPRCGLGPCTNKPNVASQGLISELKKLEDKPMNFNIIAKATISSSQVTELLTKAIEKETGMKVDSIKFNITKHYDMRNEPCGETLNSIDVVFKNA